MNAETLLEDHQIPSEFVHRGRKVWVVDKMPNLYYRALVMPHLGTPYWISNAETKAALEQNPPGGVRV